MIRPVIVHLISQESLTVDNGGDVNTIIRFTSTQKLVSLLLSVPIIISPTTIISTVCFQIR